MTACLPCGGWCCHDENIFVTTEEARRLGIERVDRRADGACSFYLEGCCTVYALRPLECRLFPLDLLMVNGSIHWVRWDQCPDSARYQLTPEIVAQVTHEYAYAYVAFHRDHQPAKYAACSVSVLAPFQAHLSKGGSDAPATQS